MINPASLDLSSLPWMPLEVRSAFPKQPAIYFAVDSQGCIQYIGRSINPKRRWAQHHKHDVLAQMGSVKIVYLFIDAIELLPEIEAALIQWFDPPLNGISSKSADYDETKKPKQFLLTETASSMLDELCKEDGVTRSEFLERAIRSNYESRKAVKNEQEES